MFMKKFKWFGNASWMAQHRLIP